MTTHERQEYAAQLKREMNCCQAVVCAFADTLDIPEDKLMQLAARHSLRSACSLPYGSRTPARGGYGFGSGMGTMEGTCGALVGAIMVSGLRTNGEGTISLSRKMLPRFKELCGGATTCRDLKGIGTGKVLCSCENCVRNAVLAAEEAMGKKGDI